MCQFAIQRVRAHRNAHAQPRRVRLACARARRMANWHMANQLWRIGKWRTDIWQNDVISKESDLWKHQINASLNENALVIVLQYGVEKCLEWPSIEPTTLNLCHHSSLICQFFQGMG